MLAAVALLCPLLLFAWKTVHDLAPIPASLPGDPDIKKPQILDRNGIPLSVTYQNKWSPQTVPFHEMPALLRQAFVESEDRRFYAHNGVDWRARVHALFQNLKAMRGIRGASTITEQAIRILHPRPRTVWSRWLEGIEAGRLENRFSKTEILEFYLNQVPFGHQRRGVVEAARYYFDRDLQTLTPKEMLALAVLVRAPSGLDPRKNPGGLEKRLTILAGHMLNRDFISEREYRGILDKGFEIARPGNVLEAPHFVQQVLKTAETSLPNPGGRITSSLDGHLQQKAARILQSRLEALKSSEIGDGAVLAVDNQSDRVLVWVSGSTSSEESGSIDAVTAPRQPGSALKPFLYALAMEMGWNPATLIEDTPLTEQVGSGLHTFRNYSRAYYGSVRLRDALGNSLNTPAIRTIQFTGTERFLQMLQLLGISSLKKSSAFYGQGLALGDGEVSLFELVQAYAVLARRGEFRPLRLLSERHESPAAPRTVINRETASLIADILSDPESRRLEFGDSHLLRFPVQTAVKTGTSTDHKDCWAVGFTDRHTVGVWMGNLDRRPTRGLTGAMGPALVLRAVFAELNKEYEPRIPLQEIGLTRLKVCSVTGMLAGPQCPAIDELFERDKTPADVCSAHAVSLDKPSAPTAYSRKPELKMLQPTPGLQLAVDPRIPAELQAFALKIPEHIKTARTSWILDGEVIGQTGEGRYEFLWGLSRGAHVVRAKIWSEKEGEPVQTPEVVFTVK